MPVESLMALTWPSFMGGSVPTGCTSSFATANESRGLRARSAQARAKLAMYFLADSDQIMLRPRMYAFLRIAWRCVSLVSISSTAAEIAAGSENGTSVPRSSASSSSACQ